MSALLLNGPDLMANIIPAKGASAVVLGGGLSGLAAGARLAEKGFRVTVLEKNDHLGGVAANFTLDDGRIIPRSYHHILWSDTATKDILRGLGLLKKVAWRKITIKLSLEGQLLDLSNPFDLFSYRGLPFGSKIKLVVMGARSLFKKNWNDLEGSSVKDLICGWGDKNIYEKLFVPLVDMKFGSDPAVISASWLGVRLHAGEPLTLYGYIPGSSWTREIISALSDIIVKNGGELCLDSEAQELDIRDGSVSSVKVNGIERRFDYYMSTVPPHVLLKMLKNTEGARGSVEKIARIRYVSSYNMIAGADSAPFDEYWTVAHTPRRHFGACFALDKLNPALRTDRDKSVLNFFTYTAFDGFRFEDRDYVELCRKDASEMAGREISFNWSKVFRFSATVPVFFRDYANPDMRVFNNLYLAGIYMTYPELSSSGTPMKNGIKAAERMISDRT